MKKLWPVCALTMLAALTPQAACAEAKDAAARRARYLEARSAIVAKDWAGAQKMLVDLWAEGQTYDVALGLGQTELNLKQYSRAALHLAFALEHLPPRETAELRTRTEELLAIAREHAAAVRVSVEPVGAEVLVDGEVVGAAPLGSELFVDAGPHAIAARHPDYQPAEARLDALQGQTYPVELRLSPVPQAALVTPREAPPPAAPGSTNGKMVTDHPPASHPVPVSTYIAGGAATAGLVVGIGTLVAASNKESDKDDILARLTQKPACGRGTPYVADCAQVKELDESASTLRIVGFVGLGVAAAGAGTVAYLLVTHDSAKSPMPARSVSLIPTFAPGAYGALVRGAF